MNNKKYINSVNLNSNSPFPYLVLNINEEFSFPLNPGFKVPHWHEDLQFMYVHEGKIRIKTLDTEIEVIENQGVFINKNVVHLIESLGKCRRTCHVFPDYFLKFYPHFPAQDIVEGISGNYQVPLYIFHSNIEWQNEIIQDLKKLAHLENRKNHFYSYEVMVILSRIWLNFSKNIHIKNKKTENPKRKRIQIFLKYIEKHYSEQITLDTLANAAHVSKSECLRCFKDNLQTTPYQYLIDYRIYMATILLKNTELSIGDVADNVGFDQFSNFTKCFKERIKYTPREYRKKLENL